MPEGDCFYCGEFFIILTADHVVPTIRGGPDLPWNRVPACPGCNFKKNDRLPSEWCPDHEAAMKIEASVHNILPRMRDGWIVDDQSKSYFRVFALITSFGKTMLELSNGLPGTDPIRRKCMSLFRRADEIRVSLIGNPYVLEAQRVKDEE